MSKLIVGKAMAIVVLLGAVANAEPVTQQQALEEHSRIARQQLQAARPPKYFDLLNSSQPAQKRLNESRDIQLMFLNKRGLPVFNEVHNLNAARTISTDDVWPGGSGGFSLTGNTTFLGLLGIWDGGGVLTTHRELSGRALQADGASGTHYHATHVAGTMIAAGISGSARGMSYQASLLAHDWDNDDAEMAIGGLQGMNVSNHSYGFVTGWRWDGDWYWYGDIAISMVEDFRFGFYGNAARSWDNIAYYAPYYLICKSAGNDRTDDGPGPGGGHFVQDGGWVWVTDTREPDGGADDYDCIGWNANAKNILTVASVRDISSGYSNPSQVIASSFSSFGPTDDGRIKPDIAGNGASLYSCLDGSNSSYGYLGGTSMSTPNVSGSVNLLYRYYEETHTDQTPLSATVKALVLHTADESGPNPGPDYMYGWGLMNTLKAAELIEADVSQNGLITENGLSDGEILELPFTSDGVSPLRMTMVWTDPAGTPPPESLNPTTLMLVNDLDLRLVHVATAAVYAPWILDPITPSAGATTGDNFRDNVEQVYVAAPPAGDYLAIISHKGTLAGDQAFSLVSNRSLAICNDADNDGFGDPGNPDNLCPDDNCPDDFNPGQEDADSDGLGDLCDACPADAANDVDGDGICGDVDNCPDDSNPGQEDADADLIGDACCCIGVVGDANQDGGPVPTIGDVSSLIDMLFITREALGCLQEADVNQSGGANPIADDVSISDVSKVIDFLFITGPSAGMLDCP